MDERESGKNDPADSDSENLKDEKQEPAKPRPKPAPVPAKIGEPPGNLQKREEWFRKRSG
jgi:hypothetical protein